MKLTLIRLERILKEFLIKRRRKAKKVKNKTIIHLPAMNQPAPIKKEVAKSVELNQQTNKVKKAFNFDW